MNAAAFLSSFIEIALAIAGFAGIVAAIRQRTFHSWPADQLILLQILFTASAASVVLGLLPSFLMETGIGEANTWKVASLALLVWMAGALAYRERQSRAFGVANQIPKVVLRLTVIIVPLQIYNAGWAGAAWPYLVGVLGPLINGFSVFLILVLRPSPETEAVETSNQD
ncbi:MAG: hypothetical protein ACPHUF_16125 [Gammaproteobacteria bacterium]